MSGNFEQLDPEVESLQGRKGDFLEDSDVPVEHLPAEYTDISPVLARRIEELEIRNEQLEAAKEHQDMVFESMAGIIEELTEETKTLRRKANQPRNEDDLFFYSICLNVGLAIAFFVSYFS